MPSEAQLNTKQLSAEKQHTVFHLITHRQSHGLLRLPVPNANQLATVFALAATAPDHHRLKPWRFLVLVDDALKQLGDVYAQAYIQKCQTLQQPVEDVLLQRAYKQPLRAPMIIVAITQIHHHDKVPKDEQLLSMGAAVQNLLLGLQAFGFASMWRTGEMAHNELVKQSLGLQSNEDISGFIYVGTPEKQLPQRKEWPLPEVYRTLNQLHITH